MFDDDSEFIDNDQDPDDMDPELADLEELEDEDEDADDLDDFGEPPTHGSDDDDQFGRLRH